MADQSQADNPQKKSRYERVKKILNDAQGDANPSYQGHKRFWNLPLEEFLSVTIYGVRMIAAEGDADVCDEVMQPAGHSCCGSEAESAAPAADTTSTEPSCCGSESTAQPEMKPSRGRGAASGLIKGLKGEFPFDGTQFPRLPWSGKAVGASDIIFIESWIDDGCPATDEPAASSVQVNQPLVMARAQGHEEHPLSTKSINEFSSEAGKTKVRKNIECLTADELERFRHVVKVMKCYDKFSRYDQRSFRYWADIHANNCQHGWEQFLSWHRLYLYYFEEQMEDIDPTVTLPYWDWTLYRDDVLKSIEDMKASAPKDNGV